MTTIDLDDPTRHHCAMADDEYAEGVSVLFYDVRVAAWTLAMPDWLEWDAWDRRGSTGPHPLRSRRQDDYASWVEVAWCPFCGEPLAPEDR